MNGEANMAREITMQWKKWPEERKERFFDKKDEHLSGWDKNRKWQILLREGKEGNVHSKKGKEVQEKKKER